MYANSCVSVIRILKLHALVNEFCVVFCLIFVSSVCVPNKRKAEMMLLLSLIASLCFSIFLLLNNTYPAECIRFVTILDGPKFAV